MNALNALLVGIGVIIFILAILGSGLLFSIPYFGYYGGWVIGVILAAIGLMRNEKEKKQKQN